MLFKIAYTHTHTYKFVFLCNHIFLLDPVQSRLIIKFHIIQMYFKNSYYDDDLFYSNIIIIYHFYCDIITIKSILILACDIKRYKGIYAFWYLYMFHYIKFLLLYYFHLLF